MSEREEKIINKIAKLEKAHNSLKIEDEIEKYKAEIKKAEKEIENTKKEINKLSSKIEESENSFEEYDTNNNQITEGKNNELRNIMIENNMKRQILSGLKNTADKYKNEEFLLDIVKNWNPQTMFKYIELYDKK